MQLVGTRPKNRKCLPGVLTMLYDPRRSYSMSAREVREW